MHFQLLVTIDKSRCVIQCVRVRVLGCEELFGERGEEKIQEREKRSRKRGSTGLIHQQPAASQAKVTERRREDYDTAG